ncbi:SusC/RagA family TonB-linked outer membrane protein [Segetibacter sp. 3557_3]|uniref:SusC/RagA family TonB-linked outer membrane protein n=1 Tax=Segetibacter sp. 3557_3 TaxID=2547429 RepID=UPI001058835C|nr:SusC/RagA family TonB-linked outer membrane protein [Segetibacter sp. 3557_3]TDH21378.1 SusC/RagA family TonB-linked outer membrane protein [Segetibacter sp. 3557_3]
MNERLRLVRKVILMSLFFLFFSIAALAQTGTTAKTITGKVTDEQGKALEGVTVTIKGTSVSAATNASGNFTLNAPANATLVFTSVGFAEQEIDVENRSSISASLKSSSSALTDVVVVGYGTRKKTDVTGAVASITGEKLRSVPTTNLTSALQGRVAGVEAMATSFRPGSGSRIRIRGNRSLNASNEPLYVVDGVPVSYTIDDMSPLDIETIDVLKDASSTAIYGVRGANGVVQITTKKGRAGKVSVQYEGSTSFDNILKHLPVFNAVQLTDSWRQAFFADRVYNFAQNTTSPNNYFPNAAADAKLFGGTTGNAMWEFVKDAYQFTTFDRVNNIYIAAKRPTTPEERALLANLGLPVLDEVDAYDPSKIKSFDWQKEAIRQGVTNNQSINLSVGSEKVRASFGGSYFKQKGIEYGQDYTRYTISNNTEFKPVKFLTFGNSITFSNSIQNVGPSLYANASGMLPITKPYDSLGNFDLYPNDDQQIVNGLNDVNTVFNEIKANRIFGNLYAEVSLFKGLKYRTVFGLDYRNTRQGRFNGAISSVRQGAPANASYGIYNNLSWTYDNILNYDLKIKNDHTFNVTLLHEMQSLNRTDSLTMNGENLIFEQQKWYSLNRNTSGTVTGTGAFSSQQLLSFMGRVEYGYKSRYLLTLSNRYDVSSVLAAGKQGEYFPSAAFAWRVDNEQFFRSQNLFTSAKLRVGIGRVGNASIEPYQTNGPLQFTLYNWLNGNAAIGLAPTTFRVPDLTWEKTTTQNLGIEFGMFKNRINATIDLYKSSTTDVLQRMTIPATNGVTNMLVNLGEVSNKGIDIAVSTVNFNTPRGFRWTTDIVFSRNREAIVSLDETGSDNLNNLWFIGQPLRVYYNYQSGGIYQYADTAKGGYLKEYLWSKGTNSSNTAFRPGKIRVVDLNGDTLINAADKTILGYDNAKWTGSLTNTVSYKNFELNFTIYYRHGGMYRVPRPGMVGRYQSSYANYWTPTNPSNEYQQPTRTSDIPLYWEALGYRNGSFARVRNISLTYRLPESIVSRLRASNMAVYVNAVNPFLFHKASDYDPETIQYTEQFAASTGNPGPGSYSYRSVVIGVRLGL